MVCMQVMLCCGLHHRMSPNTTEMVLVHNLWKPIRSGFLLYVDPETPKIDERIAAPVRSDWSPKVVRHLPSQSDPAV
jgi:hypothetical protein